MVALIEDASALDPRWIAEHSPYALVVVFVVWLLYWIPRWFEAAKVRYDASVERSNERHQQLLEASQRRHERLLETFREEGEKNRRACSEDTRITRAEILDELEKLESKIERRSP